MAEERRYFNIQCTPPSVSKYVAEFRMNRTLGDNDVYQ